MVVREGERVTERAQMVVGALSVAESTAVVVGENYDHPPDEKSGLAVQCDMKRRLRELRRAVRCCFVS